jgi:lipid A 4'-phosphatase
MSGRLVIGVIGVLALAAAALTLFPGIDPAVSRLFFDHGTFIWNGDTVAERVHRALPWTIAGLVAALTLAWAVAGFRRRPVFGIGARGWLFVLLVLGLGPGLLVNVVLKDNWGRARPEHVAAFGGPLAFTPAGVLSDQCDKNCSFVAGDPSVGFSLHAFGYVVPRRRRTVLLGGLAAGGVIGLMRIGQGAHFLGDVVYCALVVVLLAALLYRLIYGAGPLARLLAPFDGAAPRA